MTSEDVAVFSYGRATSGKALGCGCWEARGMSIGCTLKTNSKLCKTMLLFKESKMHAIVGQLNVIKAKPGT